MDTPHAFTPSTPPASPLAAIRHRLSADAPRLLVALAVVMAVLLLGLFGAVVRGHVATAEAARHAARDDAASPVAAFAPEGIPAEAQAPTGPRVSSLGQAK